MFKSWIDMWKNTFNYTGTVTRKGYWLAILMNIIVMYIGVIPYALFCGMFTDNVPIIAVPYIVVFHLPVLSLYFRRARDAGWKPITAIYLAIVTPIISGILAGIIRNCRTGIKFYSTMLKITALGFALFFYSGVFSMILYGSPTELPVLTSSGLLLAAAPFVVYAIKNWKLMIAIIFGIEID